jgi:hypothetical protein
VPDFGRLVRHKDGEPRERWQLIANSWGCEVLVLDEHFLPQANVMPLLRSCPLVVTYQTLTARQNPHLEELGREKHTSANARRYLARRGFQLG